VVDLDIKDRKILYHLDLNCRQSNAQIGKKVGLSRKGVEYRIKKMEKEGVITRYWTDIDSYRLGYDVYRYYIALQNASSNKKDEILDYFAEYNDMWIVDWAEGNYDIVLVIWIKNVSKFYKFWDDANELYGDYFVEKAFSVYLKASNFPLSFLLKDDFPKKDRDKYEQRVGGEKSEYDIDWMDYQILDILSVNAKISLVDLSRKIGCSSQNLNYRIKNLHEMGIIQGYKLGFNSKALGLEYFKVNIWLRQPSKRRKLWDYLKYNPHVIFLNTSAGYADIEIEFVVNSLDSILELMDELSSKFPNSIRKYTYFRGQATPYKIRSIPELTEKDFKE